MTSEVGTLSFLEPTHFSKGKLPNICQETQDKPHTQQLGQMWSRGAWTQVELKSECPVVSSLIQNAAAASLAPLRGIRFLKTHVFARGYYKGEKCAHALDIWQGRHDTWTPLCDAIKLLRFDWQSHLFHRGRLRRRHSDLPTLGASEQLNSSSFVQVKDSNRLILKTWGGRWGRGPLWQGDSGASVMTPKSLAHVLGPFHSQRHT